MRKAGNGIYGCPGVAVGDASLTLGRQMPIIIVQQLRIGPINEKLLRSDREVTDKVRDRAMVRDKDRRSEPDRQSEAINFGAC